MIGMASVAAREWQRVPDEDGKLIEAARGGDMSAADELLARHELVVHRTCRHLLPHDEDIEGAVQEALLRALKGLSRFTGEGSFAGWLATIAVNLCRDRLRRRRLVPLVPLENDADGERGGPLGVLPAGDPDPERAAMARQAVLRVRREVAELPERQREVFTLRFFVGMELDAIAEALGLDVGTVKTHLHRAVRRVRLAAEEAMP
jgi:RNA polymerase sigma factor (sigma-70 family)